MAGWDQEHDHDLDLGKGTDVGLEVENTSDVIEKEIEVAHGETNLHHWVLEGMSAGAIMHL